MVREAALRMMKSGIDHGAEIARFPAKGASGLVDSCEVGMNSESFDVAGD